jgi:hypothetical protein
MELIEAGLFSLLSQGFSGLTGSEGMNLDESMSYSLCLVS